MQDGSDLIDEIRAAVETRTREEEEQLQKPEGPKNDPITESFIADCFFRNEVGDACLFRAINENKVLYNRLAGEYLVWNGQYYERDLDGAVALSLVDDLPIYLDQWADSIKTQASQAKEAGNDEEAMRKNALLKKISKRIERLQTDRGRKNCLSIAKTLQKSIAIDGTDFDKQPLLLPCRNGVIDLRTGELRGGRYDDRISKASLHDFKGIDCVRPGWSQWLLEICENRQNVVDFLQRLLGYMVTGLTSEHIFVVLSGIGRNGKSLFAETISYVLGDLAGPIPAEMLLDQGFAKSPSGPSPDIMTLRGLRIAFASETDENRRFSPAKVKWLSSSDTLVGRNPHDRAMTRFSPTHKLVLLTNSKPHAPSHDFAFWERLILIPFNLSFVDREPREAFERKADKGLAEKLKVEASGILAWLVHGAIQWQEQGLNIPSIIKNATAAYRREEDTLADFIEECCYVDQDAKVGATDLYAAFSEWYEKNISKKGMSQKKFGSIIGKKFEKKQNSPKNTYVYFGIRLNA